jgi:hypothetical protein
MRVLLRSAKTRLYCVGIDQWTQDPDGARDFELAEQAIQFGREEQLTGMEVVLSYDDPFCDLVLPI